MKENVELVYADGFTLNVDPEGGMATIILTQSRPVYDTETGDLGPEEQHVVGSFVVPYALLEGLQNMLREALSTNGRISVNQKESNNEKNVKKNRQKVLTGSDKFGNMDKLSQDNGHAYDDEDMTFREMRTKLKKLLTNKATCDIMKKLVKSGSLKVTNTSERSEGREH